MLLYGSLEEAFISALSSVIIDGIVTAPRASCTLETMECQFRIANPRSRVIFSPYRKWNIFYALGEMIWHLSGSNDLSQIAYYSRFWKSVSEDGASIQGSCYGSRIFHRPPHDKSPWEQLKDVIATDPDTRRAVLALYDNDDLSGATAAKDVPCTCTLQFLLRKDKLNLITYMRSNDLMLGFGYDIFLFTILQELMALEIGCDLGWYQHIVGSAHLYQKDIEKAKQILANPETVVDSMRSMTSISDLPKVISIEKEIREAPQACPDMQFGVSSYWSDILLVLLCYKLKCLENIAGAKEAATRLQDSALSHSVHSLL